MIARLTARSIATLSGAASHTSTLSAIAAIQRAGMARMISPSRRLTDPVQVRLAAADDGHHDEFGHVIVMQLMKARLERGHAGGGGLHDELTFAVVFDLPLPPIERLHLGQHVHARRETLGDQNRCHAASVGRTSNGRPHDHAVVFHPYPLFTACTLAENAVLN